MTAICIKNAGKCYQIYERPLDRLKQSFWRGKKKFFREFWAVRNASFEIRKGETVGIIGSNGSGKSTLLQLICGILNPSVGELEVDGRIAALLELGAGFNPEFTGRENVFMNAAIMGLSGPEIEERYNDIVAFANIGQFIDHPVKTYSSGMYVRLAFATAINVSPDILVVDEALSVGDVRFQQKCMAKIRQFCKTGTVIFVSHDTSAITELCTRAIWIESGKICMDGLPKFVVEKYLEHMYGEDSQIKTVGAEPSETSVADDFIFNDFNIIDNNTRQFGNRKVTIESVRLISRKGNNGVVYAGYSCEISMVLNAHEDIKNPIAGYIIKDRLGRIILGENTAAIQQELPCFSTGEKFLITFKIETWPNIQEGDYALSVGIADGTLDEHVQCHWLHDVIIFKNIHLRIPVGIFSVPDTNVTFFPIQISR